MQYPSRKEHMMCRKKGHPKGQYANGSWRCDASLLSDATRNLTKAFSDRHEGRIEKHTAGFNASARRIEEETGRVMVKVPHSGVEPSYGHNYESDSPKWQHYLVLDPETGRIGYRSRHESDNGAFRDELHFVWMALPATLPEETTRRIVVDEWETLQRLVDAHHSGDRKELESAQTDLDESASRLEDHYRHTIENLAEDWNDHWLDENQRVLRGALSTYELPEGVTISTHEYSECIDVTLTTSTGDTFKGSISNDPSAHGELDDSDGQGLVAELIEEGLRELDLDD